MDMSKTPIVPTGQDLLAILKKVRTAEQAAPSDIIQIGKQQDKTERVTAFMQAAEELGTLAKLITSRAFIRQFFLDRPAAKETLCNVFSKPSNGHNEIVDRVLLSVCRYLETHPDVAVKAEFTPRQCIILANRATGHAELQYPYSKLISKDQSCNL